MVIPAGKNPARTLQIARTSQTLGFTPCVVCSPDTFSNHEDSFANLSIQVLEFSDNFSEELPQFVELGLYLGSGTKEIRLDLFEQIFRFEPNVHIFGSKMVFGGGKKILQNKIVEINGSNSAQIEPLEKDDIDSLTLPIILNDSKYVKTEFDSRSASWKVKVLVPNDLANLEGFELRRWADNAIKEVELWRKCLGPGSIKASHETITHHSYTASSRFALYEILGQHSKP